MDKANILVVDDDRNLLELLKMRLEAASYNVITAYREEDAINAMKSQAFDLSVVDLQLANSDGISLMEELHRINPEMPVIILTAHGSIETAVEAMRKGAFNYLTKPFDPRDMLFQTERALETRRLASEIKRLQKLLGEKFDFSGIIAKSAEMNSVLDQVSRVAKTDSTIYIHGESGTGKELIAKAVHFASGRKDNPFVAINCAAIPENLLESELFGYEKGAFTGAYQSSKGLFAQAHKGTIFLDEIGDMPLLLQAKVLRVLQERQFNPVGSEKPVDVDVRVIVATNKDLETEVKRGLFREDLYYRIHVIPILLPPLRERREDIPPIAEHFLKTFAQEMKKNIKGISPMAMQKLMIYNWPGNVRELENTIEYAVAMATRDTITEDLILPAKGVLEEQVSQESVRTLKEARESFDKEYLIQLLQMSEGNVTRAAEMAGRYRADFYNLLKKYNIKPEDFKKPSFI